MKKIKTVRCRWDDQEGVIPGWYCEALDSEGATIIDSQKLAWPIDVDEYERDDPGSLIAALIEEFPSADIKALS